MSDFTPGPWKLHRGFSDWGMDCQHEIFVGEEGKEDYFASVLSVTPYCLGASSEEKERARRRWADANLIVAAPDLYEACKSMRYHADTCQKILITAREVPFPCNCGYDLAQTAVSKAEGILNDWQN